MLTFLFSRIGRFLAAAVAALGVLVGVYWSGRRDGAVRGENKALKDKDKRMKEGRDAVSDLRNADRDALIEQLRRNDDQR